MVILRPFRLLFFKAFQMDYDPHLEDDQLETQQTKEILETELTKVSNNR